MSFWQTPLVTRRPIIPESIEELMGRTKIEKETGRVF